MKHILYVFIFSLLIGCDQSDKVHFSGELEGGKGKTLYFEKLEVESPKVIDSVTIRKNNRFSFTFKTSLPAFFRLRLDDNNFITLLAEPGEKISVSATAANLPGSYSVSGSEGSELVKKLNDRLILTKRQMAPLFTEIRNLDDETFAREEARINEEVEEILKSQRDFSIAFIISNMESLAAITALYQQIDEHNYVLNRTRDIQYLKIVAESLKRKYPSSPHVNALAADAENQERQYEMFRFSAMAEDIGTVITTYPDIAMPGIKGDTIRLHSLQEKYILLLFGSSLNSASVQFSHELIPIYKTYQKKGFNIYHVSVERDREEWLRSIEFSELPWVHVAELGEGTFSAAAAYNIQQIPANYLISRDGGIVARNISSPELRRRLARALD